jgi:hypothetical protein
MLGVFERGADHVMDDILLLSLTFHRRLPGLSGPPLNAEQHSDSLSSGLFLLMHD